MKLDATQTTICALASAHVSSLLTAHFAELEDAAIRQSEKTGKAPSIKVAFAVSFNPRSNSPRVVTKIRATSALTDEAEDIADSRQLKLLDTPATKAD